MSPKFQKDCFQSGQKVDKPKFDTFNWLII